MDQPIPETMNVEELRKWSNLVMFLDMEKLEKFLQDNGAVQYIRFVWVDYSGVRFTRCVPLSRCLEIANGNDIVLLPRGDMIVPVSTTPNFVPLSRHHEAWVLRPDWASLRICGTRPSLATVMSFVDERYTYRKLQKCPRHLMLRAVEQLERDWDTEVLIGFEIEIMLLNQSNDVIAPLNERGVLSGTAGRRVNLMDLVGDIIDALKRSSIEIHHFHSLDNIQLEIALAPERALRAVDSLVLAQETIRTVCASHDIKATMAPRPAPIRTDTSTNVKATSAFNGLHLHLSLNQPGRVPGATGDQFIAGILNHMHSLCAFGMANWDSYCGTTSQAAGEWVGFGTNNRDLPVRKITNWH